jgi:hypothetical protein
MVNSLTVSEPKNPKSGSPNHLAEVHSQESGHDGSRTPPQTQYEIMHRHRRGMSQAEICRQVGCDHRTVKAVIENWGNANHRLRLEAHKAQLVDAVLLSWDESAKRGKSDSLRGWTDSLGITEPVKGQQGPQIAVQVNLHGGPEPVSLAKVQLESEGGQEQAHIGLGLITGPMSPVAEAPQVIEAETVTASEPARTVTRKKSARKVQK